MDDLSGFMSWMASLNQIAGYVYYTEKLSGPLQLLPKTDRIQYIKQEYISKNNDTKMIKITKDKQKSKVEKIVKIVKESKIKAREYQDNACNLFIEHFEDENRGILSSPCGTGKTFISYLIANNFKKIIIISPLKQFAKQNLDKFVEYGWQYKTLLIDSDGERDIKTIKKFIKDNSSFLVSSTYCSVDVIQQCFKHTNDLLIIVDEFHNLSKTNLIDEKDHFYKILYGKYRILFMSATPRVFEMENEDYDANEIYGKTVYKMTFSEAIQNKYITNYKIYLPAIHEDTSELDNELNIYQIDDIIKAKCKYLFSCLSNTGARRCIIYCLDTKEIDEIIKGMEELNKFYVIDYEAQQITSIDSEKTKK